MGFAVYDMDWTGADNRFKKMLIYISMRAQKPVCLKATIVLDLSIATMTIVSSKDYRYYPIYNIFLTLFSFLACRINFSAL